MNARLKTTLLLAQSAVLVLLLFHACDQKPVDTPVIIRPPQGIPLIKSGCISFSPEAVSYVPYTTFIRDVSRFQNEMGREETAVLQNLEKQGGPTYEGYGDKNASRQVTFTLHRLKNFIAEVEAEAEASGLDFGRDSLSITWNFGVYDHTDIHQKGERDYRSLQTLYGVPSVMTKAGARMLAITPDTVALMYDLASNIETFMLMSLTPSVQDATDGFNRGYMCPPTCYGGDEGDVLSLADEEEGATYLGQ